MSALSRHSMSRRLGAAALALAASSILMGCDAAKGQGTASGTTGTTDTGRSTSASASPAGSATATGNSSSPAASRNQLTAANLPTRTEVFGTDSDISAGEPYDEWGQVPLGFCMQQQIAGADPLFIRDFTSPDKEIQGRAAVMQFGSKAEATAARKEIAGWYQKCDEWNRQSDKPVTVASDNGQEVPLTDQADDPINAQATATAHRIQVQVQSSPEDGLWEDAMVVQADDRLLWVITDQHGQDNNCSVDFGGEAVQCGLYENAAKMAHRLMPA